MGMYDHVRCEIPLPGITAETQFQSKDLDDEMKEWVIRADGSIVKHDYEMETVPKAERPYPNAPDDTLWAIYGMLREKPGTQRIIERKIDGDVHFYAGEFTFRATFRRGKAVEICQFDEGTREWSQVWSRTGGQPWAI